MVDLPATLSAEGAKALANSNANRARWHHERISWRIAELDPAFELGCFVRIPGISGIWRIQSWEWDDEGVELGLVRVMASGIAQAGGDGGVVTPPIDVGVGQTTFHLFELPPQDVAEATDTNIFAAASSPSANWNGAALYREKGGGLHRIGAAGRERCIIGALTNALATSSSLLLEPNAQIHVELIADDLSFQDTDVFGLAAGANRMLIGGEIVQFMKAVRLDGAHWRLSGLLRGRAGTEDNATFEHPAQTPVILLDERLTEISGAGIHSDPDLRLGAIGRGDGSALFADLMNPGLSRRPLIPVHPKVLAHSDGSFEFRWTRRARGAWHWDYADDVPLVEQAEKYHVGYGPSFAPKLVFTTEEARMIFSPADRDTLVSQHGPDDLWVRQVGTYARSKALWLARFD